MVTKAIVLQKPSTRILTLLPTAGEQMAEIHEPSHEASLWEGQTLFIILSNGFQMMGTVVKMTETHVITDYGTAKKSDITYIRVMKEDEIRIRRGLNP